MGLEEEPADPLHGATEAADLPAGLSPVSPSVQSSSQGSTTSSDLKKALGSAFDAMMPLLKGSEPEDEGNTRNGGERVDADDEAALKAKLKELREKKKEEKRLKGKGKGKGKGKEGEGAPNKKNKKEKTPEACEWVAFASLLLQEKEKDAVRKDIKALRAQHENMCDNAVCVHL